MLMPVLLPTGTSAWCFQARESACPCCGTSEPAAAAFSSSRVCGVNEFSRSRTCEHCSGAWDEVLCLAAKGIPFSAEPSCVANLCKYYGILFMVS